MNKELRDKGLVPRTVWISSLRDKKIQDKLFNLFKSESVKSVLISTSFSSVEIDKAHL